MAEKDSIKEVDQSEWQTLVSIFKGASKGLRKDKNESRDPKKPEKHNSAASVTRTASQMSTGSSGSGGSKASTPAASRTPSLSGHNRTESSGALPISQANSGSSNNSSTPPISRTPSGTASTGALPAFHTTSSGSTGSPRSARPSSRNDSTGALPIFPTSSTGSTGSNTSGGATSAQTSENNTPVSTPKSTPKNKETILSFPCKVVVRKPNKPPETINTSALTLTRTHKSDGHKFRLKASQDDNPQIKFSRQLTSAAVFEQKPNCIIQWSDKRGVYYFQFTDQQSCDSLFHNLEKFGIISQSPRSRTRSVSNGVIGSARVQEKQSGPETLVQPSPRSRMDSISSNASLFNDADQEQIIMVERAGRSATFFEIEMQKLSLQDKAHVQLCKTIKLPSRLKDVVFMTELLILNSDYLLSKVRFDQSAVPPQLSGAVSFLSASVKKEWILAGFLHYDDLKSVDDLAKSNSVPSGTNPHVAAEFLLRICKNLAPILNWDSFDPTQSFLDVCQDKQSVILYLEKLLHAQHPAHLAVLGSLLQLFNLVLKNSDANRVEAWQLAALFGPFVSLPKDLSYKKTDPAPLKSRLIL